MCLTMELGTTLGTVCSCLFRGKSSISSSVCELAKRDLVTNNSRDERKDFSAVSLSSEKAQWVSRGSATAQTKRIVVPVGGSECRCFTKGTQKEPPTPPARKRRRVYRSRLGKGGWDGRKMEQGIWMGSSSSTGVTLALALALALFFCDLFEARETRDLVNPSRTRMTSVARCSSL